MMRQNLCGYCHLTVPTSAPLKNMRVYKYRRLKCIENMNKEVQETFIMPRYLSWLVCC